MSRESSPRHTECGRLVLSHQREEAGAVMQRIISACRARQFDPDHCFAIRLALEEAISNAVRHGNREDPSKSIILEYSINSSKVEINVEDQGMGFDPSAVPDPTRDENIRIPSGRGLMLMRAYMSEVCFNHVGNRVTMRLVRSSGG